MADASTAPAAVQRRLDDWYKEAVIYQIHVKSFCDSNGDGIGDFPGLLSKLDYIISLGVDTLWLLPYYPSPRRDDGYDVADYFDVHPDYGTLDDLRRFLDAAHARGLRVIGDLVLNHTASVHPWFERARRAPRGSPEHEFYVWSDTDQAYAGTRIIFPDVEKSNWSWDPVAGRYYFHRFYAHQPDLNFDNPLVLQAMLDVLRFWLDLGLDGFRLDAVAYLVEREGSSNENLPETHAVLRRLRAEIDAHYPDRMLLAEANQWPEDMLEYFGRDDECHMAFHFPLMPRMYMAIAQEDRFPVSDILRQTPPTPASSQWAIFLRNHDELTLEMVSDAERDYLWNTYAADPRARLNLGIRRRLAPLLQRDRRRIELMTALLLTLPGTPVLYYGDEIGMGDNVHLGDRDGVRTPMQWSTDRNGGFSRADAQSLVLPVINDPLYGYAAVNVEAQESDPHSLLHWNRRVLAVRRRYGALFGRGELRFLYPRNRKVLAYLREWQGVSLLCVANFGRTLQAVELDLAEFATRVPIDVVGASALPAIGSTAYMLTLPPYGFMTLELAGRERLPDWYAPEPEPLPELTTLVLRHGLAQDLDQLHRQRLEDDLLPAWLQRRGWPADAQKLHLGQIIAATPGGGDAVLVEVNDAAGRCRLLPLAVAWEGGQADRTAQGLALARIRRGAQVGHLSDGLAVRELLEAWRDAWASQAGWTQDGTTLRFVREAGVEAMPAPRGRELQSGGVAQGLQRVRLDASLAVTLARNDAAALQAPLQIARALRAAGYTGAAPLLGVASRERDGTTEVFALAHEWPANQGDAQEWSLDFLRRSLHEYRATGSERQRQLIQTIRPFAHVLGTRLGELHGVLSANVDGNQILGSVWLRQLLSDTLRGFRQQQAQLRDMLGLSSEQLVACARRIRNLDESLAGADAGLAQPVHGHLSLAQVLLVSGDLCFVDFAEPDPVLRLEHGHSGCRLADLAALLHAIDHTSAIVASEFHADDRFALDFTRAFRDQAREALLAAYFLACPGSAEPAEPRRRRHLLRLLQTWHAVRELAQARQRESLQVAWTALRDALNLGTRSLLASRASVLQ
ncbi:trehalose synthase [Tahibacter aquaticus]|uniref:maltose alpha-D-glucosyltransferase n=1 Tax=Tahibacter aquaticus TaxID=520092 RepID=A0A4R6Z0F5_9GAMM|nr:maltose alpha-D-glucosyltransferase [Tahibacter aquaticus]TDR44995.1 trehalose synthase [Tahibacter aquaticus]